MISNSFLTPEASQKKSLEDCSLPIYDNINWTAAYLSAKKRTYQEHYKLIEFQFKFLADAYQSIASYLK